MKKALPALLCFALLLSTAGCGLILKDPGGSTSPSTAVPSPTEPPNTTVPQETLPQSLQLPMVSLSLPLIRQEETAGDGTVLFRQTWQQVYTPILQDADVAEAVALDLMNRIDTVIASAGSLSDHAKNDYAGQTDWIPYSCQVVYTPMRLDSGVLSLFGETATYAGGMHPDYANVSVSYDLVTGSVLSLEKLLTDACTPEDLTRLVMESLDGLGGEYYLYTDYAQTVAARFGTDWRADEGWYLSRAGLCFYFLPYEIAPYATGTVIAEIPYEKLPGLLEDAYFPVERIDAAGTVAAILFDDARLDDFSQFSEVILNAEGTRFLLYPQGTVYDIRLEQGQWSADGSVFTPDATVFAASSLTPGDAIMVQEMFPDVLSPLRLTYRAGTEEITVYLYQSGKDGSIILDTNQ